MNRNKCALVRFRLCFQPAEPRPSGAASQATLVILPCSCPCHLQPQSQSVIVTQSFAADPQDPMLPLGRDREKGCPALHPYNESQLRSSTGRRSEEKMLLLMSKVVDGAGTRQAAGNYAGTRGLGLAAPKPLPHKRSSQQTKVRLDY